MARYRKIDPRIWNDSKFRLLSDRGKLVFLFVLTHPHQTALGAMRASMPGLAAELKWTLKAFREAFQEALSKGLLKHDDKASFLWAPNFLKYNRPESPNVVKAWSHSFDLLPECGMKTALVQHVKDYVEGLSEGFSKAFREAFDKPLSYQEQEPESEPDEKKEGTAGPPAPSPSSKKNRVNGKRRIIATADEEAELKSLARFFEIREKRGLVFGYGEFMGRHSKHPPAITIKALKALRRRLERGKLDGKAWAYATEVYGREYQIYSARQSEKEHEERKRGEVVPMIVTELAAGKSWDER